jgi:hypothetical protein
MQRGSGDRRRDGDGGAHDATMKNPPAKVKTGTKIAIPAAAVMERPTLLGRSVP